MDDYALGVAESAFDRDYINGPQPTSVSMANAGTIGQYAFYGCNDLTSASFPSVTTIGNGAFQNSGLTTLVLSSISYQEYSSSWGIPDDCVI